MNFFAGLFIMIGLIAVARAIREFTKSFWALGKNGLLK